MDLVDVIYFIDEVIDKIVDSLEKLKLDPERIRRLFSIVLILFVSSLLAGLPYVLVYRPPLVFPANNPLGLSFIDPDRYGEGVYECFIVLVLYSFGLYGLKLLCEKLSRASLMSNVELILILAVIFISIGLLFLIGLWK